VKIASGLELSTQERVLLGTSPFRLPCSHSYSRLHVRGQPNVRLCCGPATQVGSTATHAASRSRQQQPHVRRHHHRPVRVLSTPARRTILLGRGPGHLSTRSESGIRGRVISEPLSLIRASSGVMCHREPRCYPSDALRQQVCSGRRTGRASRTAPSPAPFGRMRIPAGRTGSWRSPLGAPLHDAVARGPGQEPGFVRGSIERAFC